MLETPGTDFNPPVLDAVVNFCVRHPGTRQTPHSLLIKPTRISSEEADHHLGATITRLRDAHWVINPSRTPRD